MTHHTVSLVSADGAIPCPHCNEPPTMEYVGPLFETEDFFVLKHTCSALDYRRDGQDARSLIIAWNNQCVIARVARILTAPFRRMI